MRTNRWINVSLPQTLQYSVILLYLCGAEAVLGAMRLPFGGSAYDFLVLGHHGTYTNFAPIAMVSLASAGAYIGAGYLVANEKKVGWQFACVVAVGAVAIPFAKQGAWVFGSDYIFGLLFDIALAALLLHPMSRDYQRIWFK